MCKNKKRDDAERTQLEAQSQQVEFNKRALEREQELSAAATERRLQQDAYLSGKIDPLIEGYLKEGFAPGERSRMRTVAMEDVGRQYQKFTKSAMRGLSAKGYRSDSHSGAMPFVRGQLARAGAESMTGALRDIETFGANRRFQSVGVGLARAGMYKPESYYGLAAGARPMNVQQPYIKESFMEQMGPWIAKKGINAGLEALGQIGG